MLDQEKQEFNFADNSKGTQRLRPNVLLRRHV